MLTRKIFILWYIWTTQELWSEGMFCYLSLDIVKWRNELCDDAEEAMKIALPDGEVLQFWDWKLKH